MITTVDYANNYIINERIGDTTLWEASDYSTRNKALLVATRIINAFNFVGCKANPTQSDEFPRDCDTVVPDSIQRACSEIALSIIDGWNPDDEYENLGVVSRGFAQVMDTYNRNDPPIYKSAGLPNLTVWRLIAPYLRDGNSFKICRV